MAIIAGTLARINSDPQAALGGMAAINQHFLQLGHVWRTRFFDPATTLALFIRQILAGNAAITALRHLAGFDFAPSSYCDARARLPVAALGTLIQCVSCDCVQSIHCCVRETRTLLGRRRVHVADATSTCLPDTPVLQELWPQATAQKAGCGFPIIKLLGLMDLATGIILHVRARVDADRQLGRAAGGATSLRIGRAALRLGVVPAASLVVTAAVMRVIAGGVDRQRVAQQFGQREPLGQQVQQPGDASAAEDHPRSPVQRGVVGRLAAEPDRAAPGAAGRAAAPRLRDS